MVMYPVDVIDVGVDHVNSFHITPRKIKEIFNNRLIDSILYKRGDFTLVKVILSPISPWLQPISRIYEFENNSFNWAIKNLATDHMKPDTHCINCGKYDNLPYDTGFETISTFCDDCSVVFLREFRGTFNPTFDQSFMDEYHDNYKKEKVNWIKEGF